MPSGLFRFWEVSLLSLAHTGAMTIMVGRGAASYIMLQRSKMR